MTGGKKSKHRVEMEQAWGEDGVSRFGLQRRWIGPDTTLEYNKYGRLVMNGMVKEGSMM